MKNVRNRVDADRRIAPGESPPTPQGGAGKPAPCAAGGEEKPPDAKEEEELDLRLLPGAIAYDEAKERWRSMASAVSASFEDDFPNWPIEGPRSLFFAIRELRLESKNFLEHHQALVHSSGLHRFDRAVHEHEVCCSALHFGLCYDQLNLVNCAWAERIDKRRALLEKAYRDGAQAPNFEGAEHMLGWKRPVDGTLIDPAVLKFTSERLHQKAEVDKQARLARAERSARSTRTDNGGDEDDQSRPTKSDRKAAQAAKKAAAAAAKGATSG